MPRVEVIELCRETGMGTGDHIWLELGLDNGDTITIRADEKDIHRKEKSRLYIRKNKVGGETETTEVII